ncbi:amidohydrolase family protein [Sphingobium phenoxybenzoativorans]|uniref:Amidohydrolase family protein n=1 Tax=Sphingobium phenoxybenzoativorans TaxID=1592790 RepID=A0A975K2V8_9SPHN|nr:amidohydrolase family protein [Sphingobium phenoxybenzoativorans]QUT03916.1 amidohydrolase family protein [Sphingobium phenoxybenzoativorans]
MKKFAVAAGLLASLTPIAASAETVVVTADKMVDVLTGREVDSPAVFIEDGRITSIADARTVRWADTVRHINLSGKTILPGLIDMHVHLTSLAEVGGYQGLRYTDSFWTAVGVANAKKTLKAGFTTVRNVGASDFGDVGLKQAIEGGYVEGPRIVPAGYAIGATGGHCDEGGLPPSMDVKQPSVVNGPEEARAKVRWLHKYGARAIKICATGGVFSLGDGVGTQQLTLEEMKAIADEAHMLGLKVAAHAHGDEGIRTAILAGIDTIEHCSLAGDETIKLAAQKKTWFDMDIYNDDYILATGTANGTEQESLDKEKMIGRLQRETFRKAVKAGVPMLFGTDAGVYPHGDNGKQFAKMVEWGMTPLQAIQAATVSSAKALGQEGDVGAIAVGRYGDIIAVAGDPLKDVTVLEHVTDVVKGGKLVD